MASVHEIPIEQLPITGPLSSPDAEISGLCWVKDKLIFLPQYPDRFNHCFFYADTTQICNSITKKIPISPMPLSVNTEIFEKSLKGFQGFEAIASWEKTIFCTIEAETNQGMAAYLIKGMVNDTHHLIEFDTNTIMPITLPAQIPNASMESLLVTDKYIYVLFEANGKNINPRPTASRFTHDLLFVDTIPFPCIEYRITDATAFDDQSQFWMINYYYPGDARAYNPAVDHIAAQYSKGSTHAQEKCVERLIHCKYSNNRIHLLHESPIQLQLLNQTARNWEGIVQWKHNGFLLVTDKYPKTIFAYLPYSLSKNE